MLTFQVVIVTATLALAQCQRGSFAGKRPIGIPELLNKTTATEDALGNRFGEGDSTTERLPLEANGDRDLVDRISKWPIDKQPFWYLNWKALEERRKNPQTYPQRPSQFAETPNFNAGTQDLNSGTLGSRFGTNSNTGTLNSNIGTNPNTGTLNSNLGTKTNTGTLNSNVGTNPNSGTLNSNFGTNPNPESLDSNMGTDSNTASSDSNFANSGSLNSHFGTEYRAANSNTKTHIAEDPSLNYKHSGRYWY